MLSARVRLKQMMGRAERLVERYAEPLAALWYSGEAQRFLDLAWRRLIEASCHDSVTGCGSDETAEQVAAHMAEAEQLGRAVCDLVTAERAAAVPLGSHLVFNPTPAARTGLVVLDVPCDGEPGLVTGDGRPVPVQTLDVAPTVLDDAVHPASALPILLERVYGRVLFGQEIRDWSVSREDRTLTFHVTARAGGPFDIGDVREALRGADGEWRVRILADPRRTVAALVDVPALGLTTVRPVPRRGSRKGRCGPRRTSSTTAFCAPKCATTATSCCAHRPATSSRASGGSWTAATSATPTTTLRPPPTRSSATREPWPSARSPRDRSSPRSTSSGRTAGPPPATCRATPAPRPRRTSPSPPGPSCARASRSCGSASRSTTAATTIASGCTCPLPRQADTSFAEGQFAITERGLTAEGGFGERPVPTFPASGFVAAGGLAVLLEHATEYEVTGGGREMALTLLRSIGYLSRDRNAYRDQPGRAAAPDPRGAVPGRADGRPGGHALRRRTARRRCAPGGRDPPPRPAHRPRLRPRHRARPGLPGRDRDHGRRCRHDLAPHPRRLDRDAHGRPVRGAHHRRPARGLHRGHPRRPARTARPPARRARRDGRPGAAALGDRDRPAPGVLARGLRRPAPPLRAGAADRPHPGRGGLRRVRGGGRHGRADDAGRCSPAAPGRSPPGRPRSAARSAPTAGSPRRPR
ncbi:hypothetical protein [Actinomadura madurae]|uniref:hypothetical protein n=1 Tax=Actinomadura madurae TaxID=1993 RepID=UPI0027E29DFC|nr:hypothetical protein [Actinomadura madurae]